MSDTERSDTEARGPLPEARDLAPYIRRRQEEEYDRDQKTLHDGNRPVGDPRMNGEDANHDEGVRALDGDACSRSPHAPPVSEDRPQDSEPVASEASTLDDGGDYADQRSLLAVLRYLDGQLDLNRRFVSRVRDRESALVGAARSPARSPEEARSTGLKAQEFLAASGGKITEAEARIKDFEEKRDHLLRRMARTGFFEGRWVNDDGRALYLESAGTEPPAYELHKGPWGWVKDAPPGEDPRETLRRGPLLERACRRDNQKMLLFGLPFLAYCLATALPPPLEQYALAASLVILAGLLAALPLARESLLGRWSSHPQTERRLAEESAAREQIDLIRKGEQERPPSLDELTEERLGARRRKDEEGKIELITVVEDPENGTPRTAHPDDAPGGDEDAR